MTTRKRYLGGVLLAVLVLTAGCSALLGGGSIEYIASEATVADGTLSETGYESGETKTFNISETIELGDGNETEVRISSSLQGYTKTYANGSGYFLALATPQADGVNPLGEYDREKLIAEALSRSGEANVTVNEDDLQFVGNQSTTVLETETNVSTYTTTEDGTDVLVHATRVEHGEDYVIAVGVHPESATEGESDMLAMFGGIEHDEE